MKVVLQVGICLLLCVPLLAVAQDQSAIRREITSLEDSIVDITPPSVQRWFQHTRDAIESWRLQHYTNLEIRYQTIHNELETFDRWKVIWKGGEHDSWYYMMRYIEQSGMLAARFVFQNAFIFYTSILVSLIVIIRLIKKLFRVVRRSYNR